MVLRRRTPTRPVCGLVGRRIALRDGPRDECGVFGLYAPGHEVSRLSYFALFALQHRGQESAGIAAADRGGHIVTRRELGLVSQVFSENDLRTLAGELAIGHVRYSTTGSNAWENSQPVQRSEGTNGSRREVALAHNGNLINALELHEELLAAGRHVQLDLGLGDHRRDDRHAPGRAHRGRDRRRAAASARGVLDRRHDQGPCRRLSRPPGSAPARARCAGARSRRSVWRDSLLRGERVVRVRHHRREVPARRAARRGRHARRAGPAEPRRRHRRQARVVRVRVHLLRAPGLAYERPRVAGGARAHGRDPLARGARASGPRDRRARLRQPRRPRPRARRRAAPGRRLRQEPVCRAHVHPARPGAAQARAAAEVQSAARGDRGPAPGGRRRLDRARQHDPPDRADAQRTRAPPRCTCASPPRRSSTRATTAST